MIKYYLFATATSCGPHSRIHLKDKVEKRVSPRFEIASAATSTEEIWNGKSRFDLPRRRRQN